MEKKQIDLFGKEISRSRTWKNEKALSKKLEGVELPDEILTNIRNVLDNAEFIEGRVPRHNFIQCSIKELFERFDFHAVKEFQLKFNRRYRSNARFGEIKKNINGYLDIHARLKDFEVAFEYDNIATIKWKSIEKLLQSEALYCFGIVYGPKNKDGLVYNKNLKKIQQVYKEVISDYNSCKKYDDLYFLLNKDFWLGIIRMGVFERINLKDLLALKL